MDWRAYCMAVFSSLSMMSSMTVQGISIERLVCSRKPWTFTLEAGRRTRSCLPAGEGVVYRLMGKPVLLDAGLRQ